MAVNHADLDSSAGNQIQAEAVVAFEKNNLVFIK
jgi:hypothetical protein